MRHTTWAALIATAAAVPLAAAPAADLAKAARHYFVINDTENRGAPIDYGYGPGVKPRSFAFRPMAAAAVGAIPAGGTQASTGGVFGPTIPWPIIAIHEVLLPDGRVMSYGSNPDGSQTGQFVYDVWNPALGTGTNAHLVLPNTTATDIFCSGQSVMWMTGETLITGGDLTVNGQRNWANNSTTIFSPKTNTIRASAKMRYPRWYGSVVPLPDGEMLVLGGRANPTTPAITPEVYNQWSGWRTLTGATSAAAFTDFSYPRGFAAPDGRVYVVATSGTQFYITPDGTGTITSAAGTVPASTVTLPTVMFAKGRLLSVRYPNISGVIDINGPSPTWTPTANNIDQLRIWSSGTVMANGKVLVIGGSTVDQQLAGAAYASETWDPATTLWTSGAVAAHPRLYHSNALLLPDATVLTNGGGAPGPVINLNGEIYYPPYLYNANGTAATRPTLAAAPLALTWNQPMALTVGAGNAISRVTFVRTGSATHSANLDQRFLDLPFTQAGPNLTVTMPTDWNVLLPGNWMAFVWQNGVPSVAKTVLVTS